MKTILLCLALGLFLSSCNQTREKQTTETSGNSIAVNETDSKNLHNCYLAVLKRDSVRLELDISGEKFSGYLNYDNFEKDGSFGWYEGTISGDTLKGVYRFLSEGMVSYSDKYFLMKGDQLLEGIGDIELPNDSTVKFKNPKTLSYGDGFNLNKTDCSENFISQESKDFYTNYNPRDYQ